MKVLIAEDDPVSLKLIQSLVERLGYVTLPCIDGDEAWDVFQASKPEICLLDWEMPGMNGIEVCRKIQNSDLVPWRPQKVILTARGEKADLLEAMQAGADDYLIKPADRVQLSFRLQIAEIKIQRDLFRSAG